MDSLSEEFQKREATRPDKFTLGWWSEQFAQVLKGYRGATHNLNRLNAEVSELYESGKALEQRCKSLEAERDAAAAKIGELQAELIRVAEKQETMAAWIKEKLGKNGKQGA